MEGHAYQADEVVDATQHADPSPCRGVLGRNELSPEHRRTERDDGQNQNGDVLAPLSRGRQLGGHGQRGQLINSGADSGEDHAGNEDVHGVSGGADDHAEDDESRSENGDVASTHQVGQGAHERAYGGQGEEVGENEPDPAISAA